VPGIGIPSTLRLRVSFLRSRTTPPTTPAAAPRAAVATGTTADLTTLLPASAAFPAVLLPASAAFPAVLLPLLLTRELRLVLRAPLLVLRAPLLRAFPARLLPLRALLLRVELLRELDEACRELPLPFLLVVEPERVRAFDFPFEAPDEERFFVAPLCVGITLLPLE
jgi:hypothetical protein